MDVAPSVKDERSYTFALVASNPTDEPLKVEYNGAVPTDMAIFNGNGGEVWRQRSGGIDEPLGTTVLAPGEEKRFEVMWDGLDNDDIPVLPGTYTLRGMLDAVLRVECESGSNTSHQHTCGVSREYGAEPVTFVVE
jgi:hypothetical protein